MAPRTYNPCSYLPRRLQIVVSLTAFVLFCILFLGSSKPSDPYLDHVPYGPQLEEGAHHVVDHLPQVQPPSWFSPFRAPAHRPPPDQPDSSSGEAKWFADFKWRNPFSSEVTLDEERAVLPLLKDRPPIYTYFDAGDRRKDEKSKKAEQELLQIWRRAWWAQGFKPVVLGRSEAMNNPQYRRVQALELKPELEFEMMRWLAWGNMGTGVLSNYLVVPMSTHEDPLLTFLRRGEYPELTRYQGLENALFVGGKDDVEKAVQKTLSSSNLDLAKSIAEAAPDLFTVDSKHDGVACYSLKTTLDAYAPIQGKLGLESTTGDGLTMLAGLINSHLHMNWQNTFSKGIAVTKPEAKFTTTLIEPAIDLARNLSACSYTPMPTSCPPNRPKCQPCVSMQPMRIVTPPVYRNQTDLFTITTVPHPFTLQSLLHDRDNIDIPFIRRKTNRDTFMLAATKELLGTGISSFARLGRFKDAVAGEFAQSHSLWLTAETPFRVEDEKDLEDLDWIFGFRIPREPLKSGKSETPVPGPERRPPPPKQEFDGPQPTERQLETQHSLLAKAKAYVSKGIGRDGKKAPKNVREVAEAWNLADTEAWKFVRAFNARRTMERRKFEDDEEAYLGKGSYDRWKDFVGDKLH